MNCDESIKMAEVTPDWSPSVPLTDNALFHLDFLSAVAKNPHLQNEGIIRNAVRRYERFWLPMLAANREPQAVEPPLDVHWVWHCHLLSPLAYVRDCQDALGYVPDHTLRDRNSDEFRSAIGRAEQLWVESYPAEPFDCDFNELKVSGAEYIERHCSGFKHDLFAAVRRQESFFYQVSLPHFRDSKFLASALDRYIKFLLLKKSHPDLFIVPMYDMDLLWHTHQLSASAYRHDTALLLGSVLNHDDSDQDRGPGSKLNRCGAETRVTWYRQYGDVMAATGTCFRGDPLTELIYKDTLRMPVALRCTLLVQRLVLSGGSDTDVIQAHVCAARSGSMLLDLPTVEGTPVKWSLNNYVVTEHLRHRPLGDLELVPVNRSGLWGALVGTSLPVLTLSSKFYVDDYVPQKYIDHDGTEQLPRQLPLTLDASQAGYKAVMATTLASIRPAETQTLTIHWGRGSAAMLTAASGDVLPEWQPINLPSGSKRIDKAVPCSVSTHSVLMGGEAVYTVRIIQSSVPAINVVQVFSGERVVAVSELCSADQLPRLQQVRSRAATVTLDAELGENAMLIKCSTGDWGIIKGCRACYAEDPPSEPSEVPVRLEVQGQLEVNLTILNPFRVRRFTISERSLWQRLGLPGAAARRFELFGSEGVAVDMEAYTISLGKDCRHIAQFLAAVFSVWI